MIHKAAGDTELESHDKAMEWICENRQVPLHKSSHAQQTKEALAAMEAKIAALTSQLASKGIKTETPSRQEPKPSPMPPFKSMPETK